MYAERQLLCWRFFLILQKELFIEHSSKSPHDCRNYGHLQDL